MPTKIARNSLILFYIGLVLFSVLLRNKFSVNFSDEAFYIAMTIHFLQGAKPFIDEYMLVQTSSLVLYPVYKLYLILHGTEGIVLFTRILYLTLCTSFIIGLAFCTRKQIGYKLSLLIFINLILVAMDNLFVPSYYTDLMLFLTTSLFLLLCASEKISENEMTGRVLLFFSGATAALSLIVYPSMLPLALILGSLVVFQFKTVHRIGIYLFGMLIGSTWFLLMLVKDRSIMALIHDAVWFSSLMNNHGRIGILRLHHINYVFDHLFSLLFFMLLLGIGIRCIYNKVYFKPLMFASFSLMFTLVLAAVYLYPGLRSLSSLITFIVFTGMMQRFLVLNNQAVKNLFNFVFFPSVCASFLILMTSGTPYLSFIIGLFPALLVSLIYWVMWSRDMLKERYLPFIVILLIMVNINFLRIAWSYCYQDPIPSQLTYRVQNGPYTGLYTTASNVKLLHDLQNDLLPYANRGLSIYSYLNQAEFAATYLIPGFKIDTDSIWSFTNLTGGYSTLNYFQKNGFPDLVVKIRCFPGLDSKCLNYESLMDRAVNLNYRMVIMNQYYTIYRLNMPSSVPRPG